MTEPASPWPPPAQPAGAWAPPVQPPRRPLPGSLLAAGVLLLIGAGLAGLTGVLMFLTGAMFDQLPANIDTGNLTEEEFRASMDLARGFILGLGVGALLVALAHLLAGIGVLRRRGWGRILGLVVAILGILFLGLGLLGSLVAISQPFNEASIQARGMTAEQARSMLGITLAIMAGLMAIGLAIYIFIVVVLATGGSAFEEGPDASPPGGRGSD
jgi:hypothetical protein